MPCCIFKDWRYYRKVENIRKAVYAHYRRRGAPETKLSGLWWRWQRSKGLRKPIIQSG